MNANFIFRCVAPFLRMLNGILAVSALLILGSFVASAASDNHTAEWLYYSGDQASTKYSSLSQINKTNISSLRVAWTWKTGATELKQFGTHPGTFEDTPLMIGNVLYVTTPYNQVVALNAETGAQLWKFDPQSYTDGQPTNGMGFTHRGIAAWRDGKNLRLFLNTRYHLICLDAASGQPLASLDRRGRTVPSSATAAARRGNLKGQLRSVLKQTDLQFEKYATRSSAP